MYGIFTLRSCRNDPTLISDLHHSMNREMLCYIARCVTEGIWHVNFWCVIHSEHTRRINWCSFSQ